MVAKRLLGIAFTPSWLRVASAELSRSCRPAVRVSGVPLPVGCINENTGIVEDPSMLQQAMRSVPCINRKNFRLGGVFLVVPQLLCYRTAFVVPERYSSAPIQKLIDDNVADLPGDRTSLLVAGHTHSPRTGESQTVMVVAARRVAIESYTRLFGSDVWCIGGITTGEVARFNRWSAQSEELQSKVALICGVDTESRELSIWNRGVLMASDTRYWRQRDRNGFDARRENLEYFDEQSETIDRAIIRHIESRRESPAPVDCVCFGGLLRERKDLHDRISAASGIACFSSTNSSLFERALSQGMQTKDSLSIPVEDSGLFDDVIGAIAPSMGALTGRWRRVSDGYYQSCA